MHGSLASAAVAVSQIFARLRQSGAVGSTVHLCLAESVNVSFVRYVLPPLASLVMPQSEASAG